jgi:hypothetical protein
MLTTDDYFDLNEIDNAIDNLEMITHFLNSSFAFKWKWVCIALHQALYGFTIAALQGSDSRQTVYDMRKDSSKALVLHANKVPDSVIAACFRVPIEKVSDFMDHP